MRRTGDADGDGDAELIRSGDTGTGDFLRLARFGDGIACRMDSDVVAAGTGDFLRLDRFGDGLACRADFDVDGSDGRETAVRLLSDKNQDNNLDINKYIDILSVHKQGGIKELGANKLG